MGSYTAFLTILSCVLVLAVLYLWLHSVKLRKTNQILEDKLNQLNGTAAFKDTDVLNRKLNPHLLKNALNAIQSHAYQSYYALDKLYNVLDYILYETDGNFVKVNDELDFAMNLIEINRLKTSPLFDLRIKNKIPTDDPWLHKGYIAPFICINPIENAFMHADLQSENAFISVVFDIRDGWLILSVTNKVPSRPAARQIRGGLGNRTFSQRLDTIYKNDHRLFQSADNGVYHTELKIKLRENG